MAVIDHRWDAPHAPVSPVSLPPSTSSRSPETDLQNLGKLLYYTHVHMGDLLRHRQTGLQQPDYRLAAARYIEAHTLNPLHGQALNQMASIYIQQREGFSAGKANKCLGFLHQHPSRTMTFNALSPFLLQPQLTSNLTLSTVYYIMRAFMVQSADPSVRELARKNLDMVFDTMCTAPATLTSTKDACLACLFLHRGLRDASVLQSTEWHALRPTDSPLWQLLAQAVAAESPSVRQSGSQPAPATPPSALALQFNNSTPIRLATMALFSTANSVGAGNHAALELLRDTLDLLLMQWDSVLRDRDDSCVLAAIKLLCDWLRAKCQLRNDASHLPVAEAAKQALAPGDAGRMRFWSALAAKATAAAAVAGLTPTAAAVWTQTFTLPEDVALVGFAPLADAAPVDQPQLEGEPARRVRCAALAAFAAWVAQHVNLPGAGPTASVSVLTMTEGGNGLARFALAEANEATPATQPPVSAVNPWLNTADQAQIGEVPALHVSSLPSFSQDVVATQCNPLPPLTTSTPAAVVLAAAATPGAPFASQAANAPSTSLLMPTAKRPWSGIAATTTDDEDGVEEQIVYNHAKAAEIRASMMSGAPLAIDSASPDASLALGLLAAERALRQVRLE